MRPPPTHVTPICAGRSWSAVLAAALILLLASSRIAAQPVTGALLDDLDAAAARLQSAIEVRDVETIVDLMPPGIILLMAIVGESTPKQARERLIASIAGAEWLDRLEAFEMDLDDGVIDGTAEGRTYILVPTRTTFSSPELGRIRAHGSTMWMVEDGRWYAVRLGEETPLRLLTIVYPDLAGIEVPPASLERLD